MPGITESEKKDWQKRHLKNTLTTLNNQDELMQALFERGSLEVKSADGEWEDLKDKDQVPVALQTIDAGREDPRYRTKDVARTQGLITDFFSIDVSYFEDIKQQRANIPLSEFLIIEALRFNMSDILVVEISDRIVAVMGDDRNEEFAQQAQAKELVEFRENGLFQYIQPLVKANLAKNLLEKKIEGLEGDKKQNAQRILADLNRQFEVLNQASDKKLEASYQTFKQQAHRTLDDLGVLFKDDKAFNWLPIDIKRKGLNIIFDGDSTSIDGLKDKGIDVDDKKVALAIAGNSRGLGGSGQDAAMTQKGGTPLQQARVSLTPRDGDKERIAPYANHGMLAGYGDDKAMITELVAPKPKIKGKPSDDDIKGYYKAITCYLLDASGNGVDIVSMPILGGGDYGWPVNLAAAITSQAVSDIREKLIASDKNMPEVYMHGFKEKKINVRDLDQEISALEPKLGDKTALMAEACQAIDEQYQRNQGLYGKPQTLPKISQDGKLQSESKTFNKEDSYLYFRRPAWNKFFDNETKAKDNPVDALKKAVEGVMQDYTGANTKWGNFLRGHWNRHQTGSASQLVEQIKGVNDLSSIRTLLNTHLIKTQSEDTDINANGSFARRLKALVGYADKINPSQVGLTKESHEQNSQQSVSSQEVDYSAEDDYSPRTPGM